MLASGIGSRQRALTDGKSIYKLLRPRKRERGADVERDQQAEGKACEEAG